MVAEELSKANAIVSFLRSKKVWCGRIREEAQRRGGLLRSFKLRSVVPTRYELSAACACATHPPHIICDNRWSSQFLSLERLLELKAPIMTAIRKQRGAGSNSHLLRFKIDDMQYLLHEELTPEFWSNVVTIVNALRVFRNVTLMFEVCTWLSPTVVLLHASRSLSSFIVLAGRQDAVDWLCVLHSEYAGR